MAHARLSPAQVRGDLADAELAARYRWAAQVMSGRRVLDVGCGTGRGAAILLDGGAAEVVGVDGALSQVEAARDLERPGLRFEQATPEQLPYPDGSFDGVVCFDPAAAVLPEVARVLAPGGVVASAGELEAELTRHWPRVRMLSQRDWVGSEVAEDKGDREQAAVHRTLALAGSSELPGPVPPVTAFGGLVELRRWLEHSDDQERVLERQRERLQDLAVIEAERAELRGRLIAAEAEAARVVELEVALEEAERQIADLRSRLEVSQESLRAVMASPSWRITRPLRALKHALRARLG